ncbi:MAG: biosynthetic arginine decarboxylase [Spirochaetales bacterium]|nr:biosynthetic arginine decarboxylase [Spirochaetales bacterium]
MYQSEILENWNYKKSVDLYGIKYWGQGYFGINEKGEVTVALNGPNGPKKISIFQIIEGIQERGLGLPLLLRFKDILDDRLMHFHKSFKEAIDEAGYKGVYRGVYPIKVNQQEEVIREITQSGSSYHHGLEAGSKAELIAALAYMHDPKAYIICNGYKDQEFIDLAFFALKMGVQVILVIERPEEIDLIISRAQALSIKPRIGIRIKLAEKAPGHWTDSGGDRSVFGLTTSQITDAVDLLKSKDMLDCVELLHYHLGSQISDIGSIRAALVEACRYYVELVKEGAPMGILDIGGGLAVDYDGSKTNFPSSKNYTIKEYCMDVIEAIMSVLKDSDVAHPVIINEAGRSLVAYYSVLLFNILDINRLNNKEFPEPLPQGCHEFLQNMLDVAKTLSTKNIQEAYHDAIYYRDEIRALFLHGDVSLRERALSEQIFWHIIQRMAKIAKNLRYVPEEVQDLDKILVDTYYGNFSLFQSLPDAWAIDQLFPIMPIHRLNEEPKYPALISDITCDCDGKINRFIDLHDIKYSLPVHEVIPGKDYILGVFLVGAYQETLGDLHNLFGDTNVASINLDENGEVEYTRELSGDSIADVLSYVEYDPKELVNRFRNLAEKAVRCDLITAQERRKIMTAYESCLRGYTYLEEE